MFVDSVNFIVCLAIAPFFGVGLYHIGIAGWWLWWVFEAPALEYVAWIWHVLVTVGLGTSPTADPVPRFWTYDRLRLWLVPTVLASPVILICYHGETQLRLAWYITANILTGLVAAILTLQHVCGAWSSSRDARPAWARGVDVDVNIEPAPGNPLPVAAAA